MILTSGLLKAWKVFVFSRIPLVRKGNINILVILACCVRAGFILYMIVMPFFGIQFLMNLNVVESLFFPLFVNIMQIIPLTVTGIFMQVKQQKYDILVKKLNEIKLNFHRDKISSTKWIHEIGFLIWILILCFLFIVSCIIPASSTLEVLYRLWWLASVFIVHFHLISISVMSCNMSGAIYRLNFAIQRALPSRTDENKLMEENDDEFMDRILKCVEDAYDNVCNCCSSLNEVFGFSVLIIMSTAFLQNLALVYITSRFLIFSDIYAAYINIFHLWVFFYALTTVAACCESVHHAARDLCRSLALFNSELNRDDNSLGLRKLARDVLHTVRARRPRLTACGLFDLRMNLVTGYLSLMATYSIVLLQFTHFL